MVHFLSNDYIAFESDRVQFNKVTLWDVLTYCLSKKELGVDTETQGLNFLTKQVIMFQIGDNENQFVIDTRSIGIDFLRPVLEDENILKIFHNIKFDYKFLKKWYGITLENTYDTMIGERVIHCGKTVPTGHNSLEQTALRRLGIQLDKSVRNQFIGLGSKPFTEKQIVYGAADVRNLIEIKDLQLNDVEYYQLERTLDLENQAALAFADIELNGMGLDPKAWLDIADDSIHGTDEALEKLEEIIASDPKFSKYINPNVQVNLFEETPDFDVTIKWSSPKQVLEVFQLLDSSLVNVNAKQLLSIRYKYPLINLYIDYKEKAKKANAYGVKFIDNIGADGRIHTSINQILNTGRVSSSKPNMQQIPADNRFRNCFIPGIPDWVFVSADYSSQELNIIAHGSQDPVWIKALKEGKDLHSVCAELVYGPIWRNAKEDDCAFYAKDSDGKAIKEKCECKQHKKLRNGVKCINFGLAYGMSKYKLADTLQIDIEEAEALIDAYFNTFPAIKAFLDMLGQFGVTNGYIRTFTPYRRIRWFSEWVPNIAKDRDKFKVMGQIERASKNTPIQGSGADMCKYALILVRNFIKEHKVPVKIVMAVHDQIDTIVHKDYAEEWKEVLTKLMYESTLEIIPSGLLTADTNISNVWEK